MARSAGASFHELVLMDERDAALARFLARAAGSGDDPDVIEFDDLYDRLAGVLATRAASIVATRAGAEDQAYRAVQAVLSRPS